MESQSAPPPPPPPPRHRSPPPPPAYSEQEIVFFLESCIKALIAFAAKLGINATEEKMLDGLAKDRITYREDFPDMSNVEMEQKLLRITARRMRWESKLPREEHPEMHDPFFEPYGLRLVYAKELHPAAERMLYELPGAQYQRSQGPRSSMEREHGHPVRHYEDRYYDPRYRSRSPPHWQETERNERRLSEVQRSPRMPRKRKAPGDPHYSPPPPANKAAEHRAKEILPRYGYDDKDRPYYSIFLDNIKEMYGIFIGKGGRCIKPVEEYFAHLSFRIHKYEDIDRVVIYVEEMGFGDCHISKGLRKLLRLAWQFLQAWADEVESVRKKKAENHDESVKVPTVAQYLETWKVLEKSQQLPVVSKKMREPANLDEQVEGA